MRLYIDSALTDDWDKWAERGVLFGATTNPLIFQKQGVEFGKRSLHRMIDKAKDLGLKALQLQVNGLDNPREAAKTLNKYFDRWQEGVIAKVPLTPEALATTKHLSKDMPLTLTAAYDARQAVLATAMGARYIAPYYGRLKEAGNDADGIVDAMLKIGAGTTRVLVASLRSAEQVTALAARGHDTFTLSPAVFEELLDVHDSLEATAAFELAAASLMERATNRAGLFGA